MKIKCPNCGFEDEGNYCSNCGASLRGQVLWYQFTIARLPLRALTTYWYLLTRPRTFFHRVLSKDPTFIATISGDIRFVLVMLAISVTLLSAFSIWESPLDLYRLSKWFTEDRNLEQFVEAFSRLDKEALQDLGHAMPGTPNIGDLDPLQEVSGGSDFARVWFHMSQAAAAMEASFLESTLYGLAEQLIILLILITTSYFLHSRLPSTPRSRRDTISVVLYASGLLWPLATLVSLARERVQPSPWAPGSEIVSLAYWFLIIVALILIATTLIQYSHQIPYRASLGAVVKSSLLFFPAMGVVKNWLLFVVLWWAINNSERIESLVQKFGQN